MIPTLFRFDEPGARTRSDPPAGPDRVRLGDDVLFVGDGPAPARVDRELVLEILRMNVAFAAAALGVGEPAVP
jgi:hypothetical protein